jgi:hypothetical protein
VDLRIWINLPDVPPELFDQAYHGDNISIVLARRRELFSYFRASTETQEEAEKLAFALAAAVFPAFRPRYADPRKCPGRPPANRPKYEAEFLRKVAEAYDNTKSDVKSKSTAPIGRIYEIFLKENQILADQLQVQGKPLTLGSFNKLLVVGRLARKHGVIWYKPPLRYSLKRSGDYVAINEVVAGVYEGLRHVEVSLFSVSLAERLLTLNPDSAEAQREINYLHDETVHLLEKQQERRVKSRFPTSPSSVVTEVLALMRRNGKFKA